MLNELKVFTNIFNDMDLFCVIKHAKLFRIVKRVSSKFKLVLNCCTNTFVMIMNYMYVLIICVLI